jgi:small subunit ribosomal protein S1
VQTLIEQPDARVVEGSNGLLLEIDGQIVPNYDATFQPIEEGQVVTGHVVRIDQDEVLVDIGYKSEGVIAASELSIRKSVDPKDEVHLGEEVDAIVLIKEDQDGRLMMSKKRARFEKAWRRIETAAESGEPVEGTVIEVVKGGLIIDLGVRGFLPASLVDIRRVPNLDEYMGTKIESKVIELNRSRNNVVLSRRAVLEEERKEVRQQILDRLQPGSVVEGQISNIVDFGAFVDLDGIDGLIHISELSWSHVNHPSEILTIGDTVKVKVLDIDRDRQRISLGLKQTQEDPWQRIVDTYNVNDELEGKVTKVVTFGAFVEILDGVEGLVHISELAPHHVESPREVVHPGDEIRVRILEIDSERRRLSLSAKRVEDQILPLSRPGDALAAEEAAEEEEVVAEAEEITAETTAEVAEAAPEAGEDATAEQGEEPAAEVTPEVEVSTPEAPPEPEVPAEPATSTPEAPPEPEAAPEPETIPEEAPPEPEVPAEPADTASAEAAAAPEAPEQADAPEAAAEPEPVAEPAQD